ncbi:MAG TPA: DsbA family protein [Gemmatimonadaceae bacterium]|nr:DsbA family protein [Gemmatimonadaceae bacterium]
MKRRYPLLAATAAAFVVVLACGKSSSASAASATAGPDSVLLKRADHARIEGSADAPVWVIEVSDFQCPYCRQFHDDSYGELKRAYVDSGKVRIAYVNFPLSMHRNAFAASESAMCAAAQNKFWEMHDALFITQKSWEGLSSPQKMFDSLAVAQGVELPAFQKCVSGHLTKPMIEADIDRATKQGVESTPTFLIGGMMVTGAQPLANFRRAIDSALVLASAKH